MGMRPYVVRQGDYWTKLAFAMRFDADEVWNHAKNEELRTRRPNREMLAPGDVVHVPDTPAPELQIEPGGTKQYKASVPKVEVVLTIKNGDVALASERFLIRGLGPERESSTDGDGTLRLAVPVHVREFRLVFYRKGFIYPVMVGNLDPAEESSGIRQRLEHLGFYGHAMDPHGGESESERDRRAIATLQRACGLDATGELDEQTRAKVVELHGS
jgi:hypothetical protein